MFQARIAPLAALAVGLTASAVALPATACDKQQAKASPVVNTTGLPAQTLAALPVGQQIAMQGNAALVKIRDQIELVPIALPAAHSALSDEQVALVDL